MQGKLILILSHGRPTPKPRKNNVEAEIHFNITEERETIFTCGFLCLNDWLSGFSLKSECEYKFWMWVVKMGNFQKWPKSAKNEIDKACEKWLYLTKYITKEIKPR